MSIWMTAVLFMERTEENRSMILVLIWNLLKLNIFHE